jgi:anti-sigma B factor antagonist
VRRGFFGTAGKARTPGTYDGQICLHRGRIGSAPRHSIQEGSDEPLRPAERVQIESRQEGGDYIIRMRGELDLASCLELEEAIRFAERTDAARIVVDVDGLDFIDSTGLRVLLAAKRRADCDGNRLRFTRGSGHVADMFRLTALDRTLPFLEELEGDRGAASPHEAPSEHGLDKSPT